MAPSPETEASFSVVLEQLNEKVIFSGQLTDSQKAHIGEKIGVVSYRLQDGSSEYLQLLDLGVTIIKAFTMR